MKKEQKAPLNIGIIGHGPGGIIAGISLSRSGHKVTMFEVEKDIYGSSKSMNLNTLDKTKTYPIDIGSRGVQAVEYINAYQIFAKYNNLFKGIKVVTGYNMGEDEKVPGFTGTRIELMWALAEAREQIAPEIKVIFDCKVKEIDCGNTIVKTTEHGEHQFDLIVGADGAGSIVRRSMEKQLDDINVINYRGEDFTRSLYLDNEEECKKLDPEYLHIAQLEPLVVMAPIKFTDNKNGSAFVGIGRDFKTVAECRAFFKSNGLAVLNKLTSDKEIELFIKSEKFNIAKSALINQYYSGDNLVLIGDAAHPFKPMGQGINMAMWDGMQLDLAISHRFPNDLGKAIKLFSDSSKPEGDAAIFLAQQFESVFFKLYELILEQLGFVDKFSIQKVKYIEYSFVHCRQQVETYKLYRRRFIWYWLLQTAGVALCLGDQWLEGVKAMAIPIVFGGALCFYKLGGVIKQWAPYFVSMVLMGGGAAIISTLKVIQKNVWTNPLGQNI